MTVLAPRTALSIQRGFAAIAGAVVAPLATVSTTPRALYGLTGLVASQTTPPLRVQRASDNAQQDIALNANNKADKAAAITFAAGSALTLVKVYEATGSGLDITVSGTIQVLTSGPDIELVSDGGGSLTLPAGLNLARTNMSLFLVGREQGQNGSPTAISLAGPTSPFGALTVYGGGYNQQVAYDNAGLAVTPQDGRVERTASTHVFGVVIGSSGGTLIRDAQTATFPAPSAQVANTGGSIPITQGFGALAIYPAGLSSSDTTTIRKSLQLIYNTNADVPAVTIGGPGDSKWIGVVGHTNMPYLLANDVGPTWAIRDYGVSGTGIGDGSGFPIIAQPDAGSTGVCTFSIGTNDLATISPNITAAQLWASYQAYAAGMRGRGYTKFVALTITPRSGITTAQATQLSAFNAMLRANPGSLLDTVADYGTISQLGTEPSSPNTAYLPDGLHENAAAYALEEPVLKSAVNAAVATASKPSCTTNPAVTGSATVGQALTCSTGTWGNSPTSYAYQWSYGDTGAAISGATSAAYTAVSADVGHTLTCVVRATNAAGTSNASLAATPTSAVVAAGGTLLLDTLSATSQAALSVRKLRSAYSGTAATVLQATNNAAATLAYDTSVTPPAITMASIATITAAGSSGSSVGATMSLATFAGSADVSVTRLPDQTGNGGDYISAQGPLLVSAGLLVTPSKLNSGNSSNTTALLDFGPSQRQFESGGFESGPQNNTRTVAIVIEQANTTSSGYFFPSVGSGFWATGYAPNIYGAAALPAATTPTPFSPGPPSTVVLQVSPAGYAYMLNGAANGSGTATTTFVAGGKTAPRTGSQYVTSAFGEWIVLDGTLPSASDLAKIQASQKAQWGTP